MGGPSAGRGGGGYGRGSGGGGRGYSGGRPDPPLLNAWISRAASADELLNLFAEHGEFMDAMHHGNLWNKLGKQLKGQHSPSASSQLHDLAASTTPKIGTLSQAQQLANIAGGAASAGLEGCLLYTSPSPRDS